MIKSFNFIKNNLLDLNGIEAKLNVYKIMFKTSGDLSVLSNVQETKLVICESKVTKKNV